MSTKPRRPRKRQYEPVMDERALQLIEDNIGLARHIAFQAVRTLGVFYSVEELTSITMEALVTSAALWSGYCEAHGFDPNRTEFFMVYVARRMNGAIKDQQRTDDPYSRVERQTIKAIPDGEPLPLPARGSFVTSDEGWATITQLAPAPAHESPENLAHWHEIGKAAVTAYDSLSGELQLALAFSYLKPLSLQMDDRAQTQSIDAAKTVICSVATYLGQPDPDYSRLRVVHGPSATIADNPIPNAVERFRECLAQDPGTLVDLAKRCRPRRGRYSQ